MSGYALRTIGLVCTLVLAAVQSGAAQATPHEAAPRLLGDTLSAPAGCSTAMAIGALRTWIRALATGDADLARRSVAPGFVWVRVNRFRTPDSPFVARDTSSLMDFVRRRAPYHDRWTLQSITFNGWRENRLRMGPIFFLRTADDLGSTALEGFGKAEYECPSGLYVLSVGRREPW